MNMNSNKDHFPDMKLLYRGKVRDIYDFNDKLLIVTTDRISAFDVVMNNPVPDKGKVLTQISLFWFDKMKSIIPNHLVTADISQMPDICHPYASSLEKRSMLVKKTKPLPVECVVRGYISGSGWKSYQKDGTICGIRLPKGLKESAPLPEPIFTPSTKAEQGEHDENISFETVVAMIGQSTADKIKSLSLDIYEEGRKWANEKGIIIADTKFEFGMLDNGELILIDEVLTPDSSRFWPKDQYQPGGPQVSFDKQFIRDHLEQLDWNKQPPPPELATEIIEKTREKYIEAMSRLTGITDV
ncbi:MAG: phosphoribosylaminoimidazole-succinocarboxamide synthase [Candidatus Magnetoglobus multicellularis str. Araruama]|uniref:Phosphoribosylaminoimidazole-succinocarboxamide synthase n=1 Tax=Candidatus Magnetoglobus multicellularis str. Araruama TaxID=890399 RepID=A0A1V1P7M2_9BACT|nr:MAG: phosphoribosylaminoimidazole-succinocarboxamide synthase [Candidatus Magnetoglobus multicellularis str. Araruama]